MLDIDEPAPSRNCWAAWHLHHGCTAQGGSYARQVEEGEAFQIATDVRPLPVDGMSNRLDRNVVAGRGLCCT
jgi:hypothetical protein